MLRIKRWLEQNWLQLALLGFVVSRLYILLNPTVYVRYFEEYANIWYYGVPPYLMHWFEYPPATIPFISLPLLLDLAGVGKYRLNFRIMALCFDVLMFVLMTKTMKKLGFKPMVKIVSLGFYLLITMKAKDFMYENLDMLFALSLFIPAVAPLLISKGKSFIAWLMFWLGTGVKLINIPLAALYFWSENNSFKPNKKWLAPIMAAILIWALPIIIFRSSLGVIYVYHKNRTLQADSIPSLIVRGIDIFTHTEQIYLSDYKSYDIRGPLSKVMYPISNIALGLLILLWLGWVWHNRKQTKNPVFLLKATLVFIFSYLVSNKVFSTPYHLWYIAFVIVYPYQNWKERGWFFLLAALFMGVGTTGISAKPIGPTNWQTLIPVLVQIPASILLLVSSYRLPVPLISIKKTH